VLATQNPIEQEGTYPLPEAQLDRFMVQLTVGYPTREEEERIVAETTTDDSVDVRPVLTAAQLSELLHLVAAAGGAECRELRGEAGAIDAAGLAGGAGEHQEVRELGCGAAGFSVPDPRREGAGGDGRAGDAGPR
jgi:MoxR-like ATPase